MRVVAGSQAIPVQEPRPSPWDVVGWLSPRPLMPINGLRGCQSPCYGRTCEVDAKGPGEGAQRMRLQRVCERMWGRMLQVSALVQCV